MRGPKVLAVVPDPYWDMMGEKNERTYSVYITLHQMKKVPSWMRDHINWNYCPDINKHCYVSVTAKDELQAVTRFNKLWAALPKE